MFRPIAAKLMKLGITASGKAMQRSLDEKSRGCRGAQQAVIEDILSLLRPFGASEAFLSDEGAFSAAIPALRADLEITRQRLVSKDQRPT